MSSIRRTSILGAVTRSLALLLLISLLTAPLKADGEIEADLRDAYGLEQAGQEEAAFRAYLAIPGAAGLAARLGVEKPDRFLPLLEDCLPTLKEDQLLRDATAVDGELLLARGDRRGALERYREAARGRESGYLVAWPGAWGGPLPQPFKHGCGSHKDNWLLQGFLRLEAWEEAGTEFARVWELHRKRGANLDGLGLQFVLDYAYFLKRLNRVPQALDLLEHALERIDMDRNPDVDLLETSGYRRDDSLGVSRRSFVRVARDELRAGHRLEAIKHRFEATDKPSLLRLLAQLSESPEEALALELRAIDEGRFNRLSAACRRGLVFEHYGKATAAIEAYRLALSLPFERLDVPDPDEEALASSGQMLPQSFPSSEPLLKFSIQVRLVGLFSELGQPEEVARCMLASGSRLSRPEDLEPLRRAFGRAGRGGEFLPWVRRQVKSTDSDTFRRALYQVLGEEEELERIQQQGQLEQYRQRVAGNPEDYQARLTLARLEGRQPDEDTLLLALRTSPAPSRLQQAGPLLEHYRRSGNRAAELDLIARIVDGKPPFEEVWQVDPQQWREIDQVLTMIAGRATPELRGRLARRLKAYPKSNTTAQLSWAEEAPVARPFPWVNLPAGAESFPAKQAPTALTRDQDLAYVGMPWGLAIYTLEGAPVARVALGTRVRDLRIAGREIWVAGESHFYRISRDDWAVSRFTVQSDYLGNTAHVNALTYWDGRVWFQTHHGVFSLEPASLKLYQHALKNTGKLVVDDPYLWAGSWRYDRRNGAWQQALNEGQQARVFAVATGSVWANVGPRLCRVDRDSLSVTPVEPQPETRNGLAYFGEWRGHSVFGERRAQLYYDEGQARLSPLPSDVDQELQLGGLVGGLPVGAPLLREDGVLQIERNWMVGCDRGRFQAGPDGVTVTAAGEVQQPGRVPGNVLALVPFEGALWLCCQKGLAVLEGHSLRIHPSRRAFLDGLAVGGKLYLATSSGPQVFDPETGLLTFLAQSRGRGVRSVSRVEQDGGELHFYGRDGAKTVLSLIQGTLREIPAPNPKATRAVREGLRKVIPVQRQNKDPFLGGALQARVETGDRTCLGGSQGLSISPTDFEGLSIQDMPPLASSDPTTAQQRAAKEVRPLIHGPADLQRYLEDDNPYVRRKAIWTRREGADRDYLPLLARASTRDPHGKVRREAVSVLAALVDPETGPTLRRVVESDADEGSAGLAAAGLIRLGDRLPRERLIELLDGPEGDALWKALAVDPERAELVLLLNDRRIGLDSYGGEYVHPLGAALSRHPDLVAELLETDDKGKRRVVDRLLVATGPRVLPALRRALRGPSARARAVAAKACGHLGDRQSVPMLLEALGTAEGAAAEALGKLRARDALPGLYLLLARSARVDQRRRPPRWDRVSRLDELSVEWDALRGSNNRTAPVDSVLGAIAAIGPEHSQPFYRELATRPEEWARIEAAVQLGAARGRERPGSVQALRELIRSTGNSHPATWLSLRGPALASLLLLGETEAEQPLLETLEQGVPAHLSRLGAARLQFAREALEVRARGNDKSAVTLLTEQRVGSQDFYRKMRQRYPAMSARHLEDPELLAQLADHESRVVRVRANVSLAAMGDARGIEGVQTMLMQPRGGTLEILEELDRLPGRQLTPFKDGLTSVCGLTREPGVADLARKLRARVDD